jgi:ubiquinone/menaquinone biosynthesis C-methylase UbiE
VTRLRQGVGSQARDAKTGGGAAGDAVPHDDHYSYTVYADPAMAERFEAMRFSGPIGRLVAQTQEEQIAVFLAPVAGRTILDVGTGTGRAAIALAQRGAIVTGVDASAEMLAVAERRARETFGGNSGQAVTFRRGDAHKLDFADRSFDAVVCLRVLMHTPDWRQSLRELCRVAAGRVVFDYPSLYSAAALQALIRRATHVMNPAVEAYRVFSPAAVAAVLRECGFHVSGEHRQFVLPIALHKRVNSERWTRRVEGVMTRAGLMRRLGSPITLVAER